MALSPKLELRQGQSLIMTPQLQQAIKLLQLSNIELTDFVTDQLEKNPLLEVDDRDNRPAEQRADDDSGSTKTGEETAEAPSAVDTDRAIGDSANGTEASSEIDTDYENLYTDESKAEQQTRASEEQQASSTMDWSNVGSGGGSSSFDGNDLSIESTLTREKSLRDFLTEQLQVALKDPSDRVIGVDLIDSLDESGYLTGTIEDIADRLGASQDHVQQVLSVLQKFEPSGVFARDLAECLSLQLIERNRFDPAMEALINNLDMLAKRNLEALKDICEVDAEDLADMIAEIRELDPKPGLVYSTEVAQPVVPDVFVKPSAEGGWKIELNNDTLPKVLLNQHYYAEVSAATQSKDEKAYLTDCYNNANWLVKSLDQRAKTILKVSTELVKQQDAFLVHGVQHLKPLNLRTIAEAISMHESTVSRVTANKYISTPRGLFELKYFFTSSIASSTGGEAHSAEAVRFRIRELIDNESPTKVLSDDRIVEILKGSGIDIARRTVAKYREAMKIPSSVQRRRLKKQLA